MVLYSDGKVHEDEYYSTSGYISVKKGEEVAGYWDNHLTLTMMRMCAYDNEKMCIEYKENIDTYIVPDGVEFIRFSARRDYMSDEFARFNVINSHAYKGYEKYYSGNIGEMVRENRTKLFVLQNYPLSSMPDYIVKSLSYRPLGALTHGYICFVSDDGQDEIESYTIPMFIEKDVPCTLAMMSASQVMASQTGIDAVKDAVNNHNFCIAQHGGRKWTDFDEYMLNRFYEEESEYWENLGLSIYGAVAPQHEVSDMIRVVAGGKYGCLRTGYENGVPFYTEYYLNGPRSNIFSLASQNVCDLSLDDHKKALDIVKDNCYLRILHFHESDLDSDEKKKRLEDVIDYAKEIGLIFVTMREIPTIE